MKSEKQIEVEFIQKLQDLKYVYREDICDKASLETNFKKHFEKLNRVKLSDSEFARLKDSLITSDVFVASKTLREINEFKRDDDTPLYYSLVNTTEWCKNEFEVINQLRINTDNSHHRYDVIILINGIPVVQIELKSLDIKTKKAMEQIIIYKNDIGNGYSTSLLCFMQIFIVSNETNTYVISRVKVGMLSILLYFSLSVFQHLFWFSFFYLFCLLIAVMYHKFYNRLTICRYPSLLSRCKVSKP